MAGRGYLRRITIDLQAPEGERSKACRTHPYGSLILRVYVCVCATIDLSSTQTHRPPTTPGVCLDHRLPSGRVAAAGGGRGRQQPAL